MACRFMSEHRDEHTIREMAELFGVSCSAYYQRAKNGASGGRREADAEMAELIRRIQAQRHYWHGGPRAREALRRGYGKRISRKKAAALTRENGLNARGRRKFIPTTNSNHGLPVCEDTLSREFHADRGGEKWVSDITCLRTRGGWAYLTVALGLYDRKVIGWAFSADMESAHTTIPALEMAFANRKAQEGLLFHSDRGAQYGAKSFRGRLGELCPSVRQSMSRKGNCWDNACAESFFKTLKRELETVDGKHAAEEARQSVFMYVQAYYNRIRRACNILTVNSSLFPLPRNIEEFGFC
jgi:transposase InsO family protein